MAPTSVPIEVAKRYQIAAGLDAGSAFTRLVVVAVEGLDLRYIAHAQTPSLGWQYGQITDQNAVANCLRQVMKEGESLCGEPIGGVVTGIGGQHIRGRRSTGLYEMPMLRPVQPHDLQIALHMAAEPLRDADRMILHAIPVDFVLDGQTAHPHPLNLDAKRIECRARLVTASLSEHQSLVSSAHLSSLHVDETVFEALASAYASILPEERAHGVALLNIGASSSNLVMYDGDTLMCAQGIPLGGDTLTFDICRAHNLMREEAERLKHAHGCALVGFSADNIVIELPAEDERGAREIRRRDLIMDIESRITQLYRFVEECRTKFAQGMELGEGVVLCGGGARMEGMVDLAEKVLGCPARLGLVRGIEDWPSELQNPSWTTAAGLAMYAARLKLRHTKKESGPSLWSLLGWRK